MRLEVLTFNIWGLWLVSKERSRRVRLIGEYLQTADLDVVLLQEVFVRKDAQTLISMAAEGTLQYAQYFHSGFLGGELLILSKFPITCTRYHRYTASGNPVVLWEGDHYTGKGVGMACLSTPCGPLHVYNTRTSANYRHSFKHWDLAGGIEVSNDDHCEARLVQILELAYFVAAQSSQGDAPVILGGDLNCGPQDMEMAMLRSLLPQLQDSWEALHPDEPGHTVKYDFPGRVRKHPPKRTDFLLSSLMPVSAQLTMDRTADGIRYSDHLGLQTVFAYSDAPQRKRFVVDPGLTAAFASNAPLFRLAQEKLNAVADTDTFMTRFFLCAAIICMGYVIFLLSTSVWNAVRAWLSPCFVYNNNCNARHELLLLCVAVGPALMLPFALAAGVALYSEVSSQRMHANTIDLVLTEISRERSLKEHESQ